MLAEYKRRSSIGIGLGMVLEIIGMFLQGWGTSFVASLGMLVALGGIGLFLWGCAQYSKGKGHSGWLGALGLLSILGLLVLVLLPDNKGPATGKRFLQAFLVALGVVVTLFVFSHQIAARAAVWAAQGTELCLFQRVLVNCGDLWAIWGLPATLLIIAGSLVFVALADKRT